MSLHHSTVRTRVRVSTSSSAAVWSLQQLIFIGLSLLLSLIVVPLEVDATYVVTQIVPPSQCPSAQDSTYDAVNNALYTACDTDTAYPGVGGIIKTDLNTNAVSNVITIPQLLPNRYGGQYGCNAVDYDPATNLLAFSTWNGNTYTLKNGVFTKIGDSVTEANTQEIYIDRGTQIIYTTNYAMMGSAVLSYLNGVKTIVLTPAEIDYPEEIFRDESAGILYIGAHCIEMSRPVPARFPDGVLQTIAGSTWTKILNKADCQYVYSMHKVKQTGIIYLACWDKVISLAPNGAITLLLANTVCYAGYAIRADYLRGVLYVACPIARIPPYTSIPGPGLIVMPIGGGAYTTLIPAANCPEPGPFDIDINEETGTVYVSGLKCGVYLIGQQDKQTDSARRCLRLLQTSHTLLFSSTVLLCRALSLGVRRVGLLHTGVGMFNQRY
jgi:hypothetical protein